ncbi:TPM domain-containing protein [Szabonella alba]|uniref:TPM domain-containing protein n=1 Tax=Szabonella alba TaxID=2804194 RepID=A0A8K0VEC4_9RHOB|nr:TPM domain-containing protein [Szabonella alba]MBL4917545.1 TPM domain-containing protein [Szabonella alba]
MIGRKFLPLALTLLLPLAAMAQDYPEPLTDTVSDYAGLLPPEAKARVTALLQDAREETGIHIAMATIRSQADYGGTGRFADFATGWFNAWGIGDADRNDGILILVGRDDREMRIALGAGYDAVWDGRAQRVIDTAMLPSFRNDDYAGGLEAGAQSAIDHLARPFAARMEVTETSGFPEEPTDWSGALMFGAFAVMAGMIAFAGRIGTAASALLLRFRQCPACGHRGLKEERETVEEPGETTDGQEILHRICLQCGSDRPTRHSIPSRARRRAARKSRKSGFGGGRSSGGGASGRW